MSVIDKIDKCLVEGLGLSDKQIMKLAKAEMIVIRNHLKTLEQDIKEGNIEGLRSSSGTLKFSIERIYNAVAK
jgi:hypothetical protein